MSGLGLHIALDDAELAALQAVSSEKKAEYVTNVLEQEKFGTADACETDKSWAYIHAAFNGTDPDGPLELAPSSKANPSTDPAYEAKFAIMGHQVVLSHDEYFIGLISKDRVSAVAHALGGVPTEELGERVKQAHKKHQSSGSAQEAAEYAISWFSALKDFYHHAMRFQKNIIFSVSY